jgi:hypothetical protein
MNFIPYKMGYKLGRPQPETVGTLLDLLAATIYPISQVFGVEDFGLKVVKSKLGYVSQPFTHVIRRKAVGVA